MSAVCSAHGAQCFPGTCDECAANYATDLRLSTLSARVVEAAVELRDMHERVRSALRAMYAYIQGPCDCGVCAAVDAYLAALEGR